MSIFENQAIEIEKSCTKNNGGMKMKALASDFDRTLFFYDESGSYYRLEDVQAIKHFQSLGNLFGVCTGRSYKGIEDFNPHQIDYDFYILCSGAKILGPVNIGDHCKIGANSVVLRDMPSNSTAVGIPAKIKYNTSDVNKEDIDNVIYFI